MSLVVRVVDVVVLLRFFLCCLGGGDPWLMLTMLWEMSVRWA